MKISAALLVAAATAVAAHQHHQHQHLHRARAPIPVDDVKVVKGPTVIEYVLDGQAISAQEVKEGLANGTLVLAPNGAVAQAPAASSKHDGSSAHKKAPSKDKPAPAPAAADFESSLQHAGTVNKGSTINVDSGNGVNSEFPDGQVPCSEFPSQYGAVAVPYLGLGGYTGIQNPGSLIGDLISDIETIVSGSCSGGDCCGEGMYCSYACPAGYQKSQWPSAQGATGQSVGGLLCSNGKLQLTNPGLSKSLCIPGASEVKVQVQNNLSQNVAVCRTDYPGTESETVPLNAQAGQTEPLTCPNAASYYTWEGADTSAQYYVNPAGIPVSEACQWGSPANPWGNYAPLNLGVGYSDNAAWLSIFQNSPTTNAKLDFTVEIQGDGMSGTCRYSNGQYCSGANYDDCSSTTGCTVSISSGTATFVFSN